MTTPSPVPRTVEPEDEEDEWPEWATNPQWQRETDQGTLYTLGALAYALNRSQVLLRKWEAAKILPRTPWVGPRGLRLYPYEVVQGLHIIGTACGVVGTTRTASSDLERFGRAAHRLFRLHVRGGAP